VAEGYRTGWKAVRLFSTTEAHQALASLTATSAKKLLGGTPVKFVGGNPQASPRRVRLAR
jgi:hypothetical protein